MSDNAKTLEAALARIAALEMERANRPAPAPSGIDPKKFAADPLSELKAAGIPAEHVTKLLVAHTLGDEAPADLRTYAMMGSTVSATHTLSSEVESLRRRIDEYERREANQGRRTSFSALAADKTKYPLLAAAYGKNPALFQKAVDSHDGDAAALAEAEEGRLRAIAEAVGYRPASSNAVKSDQSAQVQAPVMDNTPPPLPQPTPGEFTQREHEELRNRVLSKHNITP